MIRRQLIAVWVGVALVTGALLFVAQASEGPLDDRDPAEQRPGYLDAGQLPQRAPPLPRELGRFRRRTVVFFERPDGLADLCESLRDDDLEQDAAIAVLVSGRAAPCRGVPTAVDRAVAYAAAIGMRRPRDGGPPVGYAVVDAHGQVRYRTLDPGVADRLDEVTTIVKAVR